MKEMIYNSKCFLLIILGLGLSNGIALGQFLSDSNLINNPGLEKLTTSIEKEIETGIAFGSFKRPSRVETKRQNISRVIAEPLDWHKFCIFHGRTYCAVAENYANSGECYMQLRILWGPNRNTISNGAIAASLHHPLESGCDYRFGIWVAKSVEDPERINNVTMTIRGLQGKTRNLTYTPEDTVYLQFEIPIHEMEIGDYRYYEGEFRSLSDDTHLLIEANTDDFVFDRKARRIHRRCNRMPGGCHSINLASITFDDVSLFDITGCRDEPDVIPDEPSEPIVRDSDFITLTALTTDLVRRDTTSFYFHHDHPYLSEDELERLRQFQEELDGQILSIHGYADASGSLAYNRELSELRAQYVIEKLQEMNTNLKAQVEGHGHCIRESCISEEKCRRVDIIWQR